MKDVAALPEGAGNHPYHGPLSKPDEAGRRTPVPDEVHERVHRVVGDILAGKVIPEARRQMQEALKAAPKEKEPFRAATAQGDARRIGNACDRMAQERRQPEFGADDFAEISRVMSYERGMQAATSGAERTCPDDCKQIADWYDGYDEGKKMKDAS